MWMNVIIALCGAFLFFLLITGCVLKIGRDSLCTSVTSIVPNVTRCNNTPKQSFLNELLKMYVLMLISLFVKAVRMHRINPGPLHLKEKASTTGCSELR